MGCNEGYIGLAYQWIKCHSIVDAGQIKKVAHLKKKFEKLICYKLKQLQDQAGNVQRASFGISGGKGFLSPIYRGIITTEDHVKITLYLVAALED